MPDNPPPGRGVSQRLEGLIQQVEAELRDAVNYVNDAVVPQVRRESVSAMRALSDKLRQLADQIERHTPRDHNREPRS
jgi:hypothetical protein